MRKLFLLGLAMSTVCSIALVQTPAQAQKVNAKAQEKVRWFNAPREMQIVDERPIIKDFREAPAADQMIDLPPGPQAGGGGMGGGGSGALGGGGPTLPSGGLQLGGPGASPYRGASGPALPNARGFQGTNIPAKGFAPKGLQNGQSTNRLMGKMMPPQQGTPSAGTPRGMGPTSGRSSGNSSGPAVASYGRGYGSGSGANTGDSSRTESSVRGFLLKKN